MEIENRLDYIRSFFESARIAEEGLLPVSERDIEEEFAAINTPDQRDEEEEEFGPSPELRAVFGE